MLKYLNNFVKLNLLNHSNVQLNAGLTFLLNPLRSQDIMSNAKKDSESLQLADSSEWQTAKSYGEIPTVGVFSLIIGFLPGGRYYNLDFKEFLFALEKEFGGIVKLPGLLGRPDVIYTHNVLDFEKILRNEGPWPKRPGLLTLRYHRTVHRADFFQEVNGLLTTNGEEWSKIRTVVNPVLMRNQNVRLYLNKISQLTTEFIGRIRFIRDLRSLEVPANFEEEINRWALESLAVVALDKKLGLINGYRDDPKVKEFFQNLSNFFTFSIGVDLKPSIWRYYKTPAFTKLMNSLDALLEITSSFINEAIERLEQEQQSGAPGKEEHEKSVLEKLITIDKKIAITVALDMFLAGVDTTSSTFAGLLLSLAKNPDKQAKLRKEVLVILPYKESEFTEDAYKNMPYLRACIKESLRYYPIVLGTSRATAKDTVLSGYRVPKNTRITMVSAALMRDEVYFSRSNEYLPERWLRTETETTQDHTPNKENLRPSCPFVYLPFGFGPRTCIGRRIAEMELELCIARMVRNFYIEFNYSTEKAFKSVLVDVPNIPLKFKFSDVEY